LTATYQLPQLGHGFTSAMENSVRLALGLSPEGFKTELPLEYAIIAAHEGSTLRWVNTATGGRFVLTAVHKGRPVPAEPVMKTIEYVVAHEVQKNLGNLQVRHALPFLNDRAIVAFTFVDPPAQFVPAI